MVVGGADVEKASEGSCRGKLIKIEVGGQVAEWSVFADCLQALEAAKRKSRDAAAYCDRRTDKATGIGYYRVLQMKRHISLDDEDFCTEIGRHTWVAEIDAAWGANLTSLVYAGPNEGGHIRGRTGAEGGLLWELVAAPKQAKRPASKKRRPQKSHSAGRLPGPTGTQNKLGSSDAVADPPLWGQIFVQGEDQLGMASYHFVDESDAYVSYEAAPEDWRMDDGTKYEKRKPFSKSSYDAKTRTFRGEVHWAPKTARGAQVWRYEMIFDGGFTSISGGTISMLARPGDKTPIATKLFGRDIAYTRLEGERAPDRLGAKQRMTKFSKETEDIMKILDQTLSNHMRASGGVNPTPQKTLQLVFGDALRTWARDLEADKRNRNR